jgi:hypothetical protein
MDTHKELAPDELRALQRVIVRNAKTSETINTETMKTLKEQLSAQQWEEFVEAVETLEQRYQKSIIREAKEDPEAKDVLATAFMWRKSKQGRKYWLNICNSLQE